MDEASCPSAKLPSGDLGEAVLNHTGEPFCGIVCRRGAQLLKEFSLGQTDVHRQTRVEQSNKTPSPRHSRRSPTQTIP